jgi:hypothetical protein
VWPGQYQRARVTVFKPDRVPVKLFKLERIELFTVKE